MEAIKFIQDLAIILVTAGVAGWVCQRVGLSSVLGFLIAGVIVGPYTPPFAFVNDIPRIEVLAQLGMIFLMFSIGMRLSVRKMRRIGFGLLFAVGVSAGLVFLLTRIVGVTLGMGTLQTLFLAGMVMVSSSAIVDKVLVDTHATHERSGQTALGMTVLEDVVAVVMLTVLGSQAQLGQAAQGEGAGSPGTAVALMLAFVVLSGILGLLIVPWLLRRMSHSANEELQTLGLCGLLFGLALLAYKAGYSTALGSFLLGTIVSETPHRAQVERLFESMRDVFIAVFFVAIGLQIDPRALWGVAGWAVGLAIFAFMVRSLAVSSGLLLIGTPLNSALRTGLLMVPLGEFSFIIAQLGVQSGALPERFYPLAVGAALVTAFLAPFLGRHSMSFAENTVAALPRWLTGSIGAYHSWLERVSRRQQRNILWQLSRKRLIQISVGMLFVSGLFLFAVRLEQPFEHWLGQNWLFPHGPKTLFWVALVLLALPPLVAIWRNLGALALLYAEVASRGQPREAKMRVFVEHGLRVIAGMGMFVWLGTIVPTHGMARWLLLVLVLVALFALLVLRRKFIYWHSEVEVELMQILAPASLSKPRTQEPWLANQGEWNLSVVDCVIPDLAACRGRSLQDLDLRTQFGATVVGIERQGYLIAQPGPHNQLFPRDKVLLLGTAEQVRAAGQYLHRVQVDPEHDMEIEELRMDKLVVSSRSQALGLTLAEIAPARRFGVQIAGILRDGERMLNPPAAEVLREADELLCLGVSRQLTDFSQWLSTEPEDASVVGGA